jgi:hypothetical protein
VDEVKHFPDDSRRLYRLRRLVLYADGDYWHSLPKAVQRNRVQDQRLATLPFSGPDSWTPETMRAASYFVGAGRLSSVTLRQWHVPALWESNSGQRSGAVRRSPSQVGQTPMSLRVMLTLDLISGRILSVNLFIA